MIIMSDLILFILGSNDSENYIYIYMINVMIMMSYYPLIYAQFTIYCIIYLIIPVGFPYPDDAI